MSLLELTGAFSIFANNGIRQVPFAIVKIEDHLGKVVDYISTLDDVVELIADAIGQVQDATRTKSLSYTALLNYTSGSISAATVTTQPWVPGLNVKPWT